MENKNKLIILERKKLKNRIKGYGKQTGNIFFPFLTFKDE